MKIDYNEVWLTGAQLGKQFGCFTPAWLERHGCHLPRTRTGRRGAWVYARNKIQEMMFAGDLENMNF